MVNSIIASTIATLDLTNCSAVYMIVLVSTLVSINCCIHRARLGYYLGDCMVNHLGVKPSIQKFTGSRDRDHAHFSEIFVGVMSGLSLGTRLPNLKFASLAVSELLAFNAQKFTELCDSGHAPFYPIFTLRGWRLPWHVVWTIIGP